MRVRFLVQDEAYPDLGQHEVGQWIVAFCTSTRDPFPKWRTILWGGIDTHNWDGAVHQTWQQAWTAARWASQDKLKKKHFNGADLWQIYKDRRRADEWERATAARAQRVQAILPH